MKRETKDKKLLKLSHFGEFTDKELEKEFFNIEMKKALKYMKPMVLIFGFLFFLFIIPDYILLKDTGSFKTIFYTRMITSALAAVFYFILDNIKKHYKLTFYLTNFELIFSLSFLFIYYQYPSANFIIQDLGLIIIILAIYLLTNKLFNMFIVSITISFGFFTLSLYSVKDIKFSEFSAAVVFTLLAILISTISKYRSNYYERMQYLSNCKLLVTSITDPLTKVYNRLKFDIELDKWISYSKINKTSLSLVILDFDDFKRINDTLGHQAGDNILINYSKIIKNIIRASDILARWGGDEFVILLPNSSLDDTINLVNRIIEEINKTESSNGRITCSFGVVSLSPNEDRESFIKRADIKLYQAKASGKNCMKS
ncbi:MAG: GGDEF domain-containing protein [Clostridiaceae bacterium]